MVPVSRNHGFTLLELLVVLVVIAIGTAMVSARLMPDDQRLLDQDAERLAEVLTVAQEYSSVRADTLLFIPAADGFRFAVVASDLANLPGGLSGASSGTPQGSLQGGPVSNGSANPATNVAGTALQMPADDLLRPRRWQLDSVRLTIETDGQVQNRLLITPEPGIARTVLVLQCRQARRAIIRRTTGRFQMVRP